jgi:hypothetical protein
MLVLLIGGFLKYAVEIRTPSFMKIATGGKAMLKFCLRNLKGCNVDITDRRDL